ncbi:hypothetical protein N7510_003996 [Penicillium lagena]|uniref:uncharacterized protein n=1 Tax=Penicillium lagena TaxID=94218 RepID=UPI002541016B|nr:uncharacterized protein N7510_003996 [Penicillium lagena]KAJ5620012.1 hypothetical protein N7510_003996 [Penicillium lagena]
MSSARDHDGNATARRARPANSKSVLSVPLQKAIEEAQPKLFSWGMMRLYSCMLVAMMIAWANGYDGGLMSGISAMPQYQKYFGAELTGSKTAITFAIYFIGSLIGAPITGPLSDTLGRRWGMAVGCGVICMGACVQGSATNSHAFLGGRFFCGIGICLSQSSAVTYVAEIAHPAWRSAFTSMFNTFYFVGAFVVSWVTYATLNITGEYSWRLPIYFQCVACGIVLFTAPFLPESPRWLIAHGKRDAAVAMLTKYHGDGDAHSPIVQLELEELDRAISLEGHDKVWWDYRPLFTTHEARWRSLCAVSMAFIGQWAGNGAITYFLPAMLDQAGVHSPRTQLLYNAIVNTIAYPCGAFSALFIAGQMGRRKLMISALCVFCVEYIIITALAATFSPENADGSSSFAAGSRATVAMIIIFRLTYSFTITPIHPVYPVECFAYETRAKGEGLFTIMDGAASVFNTYATPVGLGAVGWKFYLLYVAWDAVVPLWIYFMCVETHGRTLEELTEIFRAPNPVKASLVAREVEVIDNGDVMEVVIKDDV